MIIIQLNEGIIYEVIDMEKIKVLQVTGSLRVGGAETVALNFYRYIDKERFEFDYLVYGDSVEPYEAEVEHLGGKVIHIDSPNEGYAKFLNGLRKVIRKYGPYDIIHAHTLLNIGLVLFVGYIENVPMRVAHAHSDRKNVKLKLHKKLYKICMKHFIQKYATHYVACSYEAGTFLYGRSLFEEKGIIIKNGIDVSQYCYNPIKRDVIKREFGIKDKFVIGHVGRFSKVKNHSFLLKVFQEIHKRNSNTVLLLVGDGELRLQIEHEIEELGLNNNVVLTGTRSDVPDLMQAMDVFVFPSYYEGLPVTLVEAQASGLPCVISSNITDEICITDLVCKVSLDSGILSWTEIVLRYVEGYKKKNTLNEVKKSGFDITESIETLKNTYSKDI